jgi:hypothetical protein
MIFFAERQLVAHAALRGSRAAWSAATAPAGHRDRVCDVAPPVALAHETTQIVAVNRIAAFRLPACALPECIDVEDARAASCACRLWIDELNQLRRKRRRKGQHRATTKRGMAKSNHDSGSQTPLCPRSAQNKPLTVSTASTTGQRQICAAERRASLIRRLRAI